MINGWRMNAEWECRCKEKCSGVVEWCVVVECRRRDGFKKGRGTREVFRAEDECPVPK